MAVVALWPCVQACADDGAATESSSSDTSAAGSGEGRGTATTTATTASVDDSEPSTEDGPPGTSGGATPLGTTGGDASLGRITAEAITTWRNDATAAYSIIHDDACGYGLDSLFDIADPALRERGLRAGFGVIVSNCVDRDLWDPVNAMAAYGHEIINHSWSHPAGIPDNPAMWPTELEMSTEVLAANLDEPGVQFFIFPYDAFNDDVVVELQGLGYLGVRAGERGVNDASFADDLRIMFDAYGPDGASLYGDDTMSAYLDAAVQTGGWALRELHGVDGDLWGAISSAEYLAHLDDLAVRIEEGAIWMDTPSTVIRYRRAREACGLPSVSGSELAFDAEGACLAHATTVTLRVLIDADPSGIVAEQDGFVMASRKAGVGEFYVDMDVGGGPLTLAAL